MGYRRPCDFYQLICELEKLCNRVCELKYNAAKKINQDVTKTQDARIVFLDAIQVNLSACIMLLSIYSDVRSNSPKELIKIMKSPPRLKSLSEKQHIAADESIISDFLRLALLLQFHFKIEIFFNNINNSLEGKYLRKFSDLYNKFIKKTENNELRSDLITNVFIALNFIRNSMHNNGIHRQETKLKMDISGETFSFIKDEVVKCASWHHILLLFDIIIPFIEKLLNNTDIEKIDYIRDDFSYVYEK